MAVHEMKLDCKPFDMIKSGKKTIELRLYDEKRRKINEGDKIIFRKLYSEEELVVIVVKLHIYDSFAELYRNFKKTALGYEENEKAEPNDMDAYYLKENQEKYGVVGIEISLK